MSIHRDNYEENGLFFKNKNGVDLSIFYDEGASLKIQIRRIGGLSNKGLNSVFFREKSNLRDTIKEIIKYIDSFE